MSILSLAVTGETKVIDFRRGDLYDMGDVSRSIEITNRI